MTIHKSKGLEEECVIIINLKDDILGIPNKIKDNRILNYVNKYRCTILKIYLNYSN